MVAVMPSSISHVLDSVCFVVGYTRNPQALLDQVNAIGVSLAPITPAIDRPPVIAAQPGRVIPLAVVELAHSFTPTTLPLNDWSNSAKGSTFCLLSFS